MSITSSVSVPPYIYVISIHVHVYIFVSLQVATSIVLLCTICCIKCILAGNLYGWEKLENRRRKQHRRVEYTLMGINASKVQVRWSLPLAIELARC